MTPRVVPFPRLLEPSQERLWNALTGAARRWIRLSREEARALGLSLPQLSLLGALRTRGPLPVSQWVEMIGSTPSAATGLLDRLESEGYVARARGGRDRRQVLISLTPRGRRLAERMESQLRHRWRVYSEGVPPAQLEAAATVLEQIVGRMDPADPCASSHGPGAPTARPGPARRASAPLRAARFRRPGAS